MRVQHTGSVIELVEHEAANTDVSKGSDDENNRNVTAE